MSGRVRRQAGAVEFWRSLVMDGCGAQLKRSVGRARFRTIREERPDLVVRWF